MAAPGIDPIAFELFKNALFSIADEMALTVHRTTYSAVLKDNMDYSTAMFDGDGKRSGYMPDVSVAYDPGDRRYHMLYDWARPDATSGFSHDSGIAYAVSERPEGYSFLPELADTPATAISVETAQSHLDPATLRPLRGKGIALGVLDLSTPQVETPEVVADRVRRALDDVDVDKLVLSSDCGLKYLPRESAAGKMRAMADAAALLREELA